MRAPRPGVTALVGIAAAVVALAGCAPAENGDIPADGAPGDTAAPADTAATRPALSVRPTGAEIGDSLLLEASGFPPGTEVEIGLGPPRSEYEVVASDTTGGEGTLRRTLAVPGWFDTGRPYVAVVATRDHAVRAVSEPVVAEVAPGDGEVTVTGEITGEGPECPALRTDDGEVYSLTNVREELGAGDRVTVTGRPVEMSFCMRGTTLEVRSLTRPGGS